MNITEEALEGLRASVTEGMSERRARHTLEVEKMVARLAELYVPEKENILRAAALLHDITKEYPTDRQLQICAEYGLKIDKVDMYAPKTFHARTAAALIPDVYPDFADSEIIGCVRWHTTGREDMSICEKLTYLADYIDMSRSFPDCVRLRNYFFEKDVESMNDEQKMRHLDATLLLSYDMTMRALLGEGTPISEDTVRARNQLSIGLMIK